jgi:MORN repeat variant
VKAIPGGKDGPILNSLFILNNIKAALTGCFFYICPIKLLHSSAFYFNLIFGSYAKGEAFDGLCKRYNHFVYMNVSGNCKSCADKWYKFMLYPGIIMAMVIYNGCGANEGCKKQVVKITQAQLDSLTKDADSSYITKYRNSEFVSAEFFVNKAQQLVCQVMKDSLGQVRQIIRARANTRLFYGEYFPNGQIKSILPLDNAGRYDGKSISFYEDGCIKAEGQYKQGFRIGEWKNYDSYGQISGMEMYDANGQLSIKK